MSVRETLRGLRIALANWGSAYLLPWGRESASRFLVVGDIVGTHVRAFFVKLGDLVRERSKGLLFTGIGVTAIVAFIVTFAYDPRLSNPDNVGAWSLTCRDDLPDVRCTAYGPRRSDDTCVMEPSVLHEIHEGAALLRLRRIRHLTYVPEEVYTFLPHKGLTLNGIHLLDGGIGMDLDEGPQIEELVRLTNEHIDALKRKALAQRRLTHTYGLPEFLERLETSRACAASVTYRASLWYRFFHLEDSTKGPNTLRLALKGAILTVVMLVGVSLLVCALAALVLAIGMLVVPVVAGALSLADLAGAFARLAGVLVHWMRIYRTRLTPAEHWPTSSADAVVLLQISDLHISEKALVEAETRGISDIPSGRDISRRVERLLAHAAQLNAPLLVTGDVTDRGTADEWRHASRLLSALSTRENAQQCWAILGNHDLNIGKVLPPRQSRTAREDRRATGLEALRSIAWSPVEAYPHVERREGYTLILLDSNAYAARQVLSNAIGEFGAAQLAALAPILETAGDVVVAAHHHVALHDVERATREGPFLVAIDGLQVLEMLALHAARGYAVLFIHGHKHQESLGTYTKHNGTVLVYEHPSSTRAHPPRRGQPGRVTRIHHRAGVFTVVRDDVAFDTDP